MSSYFRASYCRECRGNAFGDVQEAEPSDWLCPEHGYVELAGDDLPHHLRPDAAPLGQCNRCHRKTWSESELGIEDRLTQPDGNPCGGRIVSLT